MPPSKNNCFGILLVIVFVLPCFFGETPGLSYEYTAFWCTKIGRLLLQPITYSFKNKREGGANIENFLHSFEKEMHQHNLQSTVSYI